MRALEAEHVSVVALAGIQGVSVFTSLLPAISEIRKANPATQTTFVKDVRASELMSSLITLGMGTLLAMMMSNPLPVYVAVISSTAMVLVYETLLRKVPES